MNKAYLYIIVIIINSCMGSVSSGELLSYVQDPENGCIQSCQEKSVEYQLIYWPIDAMIYHELQSADQSVAAIKAELAELEYFILSINNKGATHTADDEKSFYYAYQLEKDIVQLHGVDTIRPSLYQLEQGINGSKQVKINLAFPKMESDHQIISILDKYGSNCRFEFNREDILNIPKLNF